MKASWRIAELQTAVEIALESGGYDGQSSARIRSVPDTRAIRYYTTLGILDRPGEMKGRTALYGRRHVLQLVSIKRLQVEGLKLGEIQQRLTGLTDRKLGTIAKLPKGYWDTLEGELEKRAKQKSIDTKRKSATPLQAVMADSINVEHVRQRADGFGDVSGPGPLKKSKKNTRKDSVRGQSKNKRRPERSSGAFWAAPTEAIVGEPFAGGALMQNQVAPRLDPDQIVIRNETRIDFPGGIAISIPIPAHEVTPEIIEELLPYTQQLADSVASIQQRRKS